MIEEEGTFTYLRPNMQEMYSNAYAAITQTETWGYVKDLPSFFSPEVDKISNKMVELGYDGHSGCSFMCVMREMQFIAKYGESKFKTRYDEYEEKVKNDEKIQEKRKIVASIQNES